jgi:DNA helicase-2/ATP-dependent DNA helicase PcrA
MGDSRAAPHRAGWLCLFAVRALALPAPVLGRLDKLAQLNQAQRQAVRFGDGPFRVLAGAGTGKTKTLASRFAYLVAERGVPAHRILAMTFSTKAAGEMRARVLEQLPGSHRQLWIQTFHSLCLRLIREWALDVGDPLPQILSDDQRAQYIRRAVARVPDADLRAHFGDAGRYKLAHDLLTLVDRAKEDLRGPDDVAVLAADPTRGSDRLHDMAVAYHAYQQVLADFDLRDFGDLAMEVVGRLQTDPNLREETRSRFQHVLVDEFQDTNLAQFELIRQLVPVSGNLCIVGDANQAIYGFRGGRAEFMTSFAAYYPGAETIQLTANYRSRPEILTAANNLISHDPDREKFELVAADYGPGGVVTLTEAANEEAEADAIARRIVTLVRDAKSPRRYSDIAVLFRSVKTSADPLLRALKMRGIPFCLGQNAQVDFEVLQDVLATMRLVAGPPRWEDAARLAISQGADGPSRLGLETRFTGDELDAMLSGQLIEPEDLPLGQQQVIDFSRDIAAQAASYRQLPPAMLLYRAIALTGHLTDRLDPETATLLRAWIDQAQAFEGITTSAMDLADHFTAGLEREADTPPDHPTGVRILTVHASKGLQWPVVFLTGMAETIFPVPMRLDRDFEVYDLARATLQDGPQLLGSERDRAIKYRQEERRLAYVAVTRAEHELHITLPRADSDGPLNPSMFVAELELDGALSLVEGDDDQHPTSLAALRRSLRRRQLQALPTPVDDSAAAEALGAVLLAQWAATGIVPGAVPLRTRGLPAPNTAETSLRFSFSQIDTYEKCPRQYLYQSVLRLRKETATSALTLGNAVHNALQELNTAWQEREEIPGDDEIEAALERHWPALGFDCNPQREQLRFRARAMVRRFFAHERQRNPQRFPIAIEKKIAAQFGPHALTGKIDLIVAIGDGEAEIIDFKTGKPEGYNAGKSLQLYVYARAWRSQPGACGQQPRVTYAALRHPDDQGFQVGESWDRKQERSIVHSAEATEQLGERLDGLLESILANDFAPNPDDHTCGYCAFRWICPEG